MTENARFAFDKSFNQSPILENYNLGNKSVHRLDEFRENLPMTATGKTLKRELR